MANDEVIKAAPKPAPAKPAPAKKPGGRGGKIKLIIFAVLALALVVAAQVGLIGYGFASLKSSLFPSDEALLEHIPESAVGVVIVDPHKLDRSSLGGEESPARAALERARKDIKTSTAIDLASDIDKLAIAPGLAVVRGRFNQAKLEERLIANRYVVSEHKGVRYLVRQGEDALAMDGSILVYGDEAAVKGSIDAEAASASMRQSEDVVRRLSQMGWDHAVIATVRTSDERPSLRSILTGSSGPRAYTAGVLTKGGGLDLKITVEAASAAATEELAKLLEERRKSQDALKGLVGEEAAAVFADIAKNTTVTPDPATSSVKLRLTLDAATLERLVKALSGMVSGGAGDVLKALRIHELLAP